VLRKCKVQSTVLLAVRSSLQLIQAIGGKTFTEEIITFNEGSEDSVVSEHSKALHVSEICLFTGSVSGEVVSDLG